MVKVFTPNKNGKIEFTKKELEKLLNEVWRDGYNSNHNYYWYSPWWYSSNDYCTISCTDSTNIVTTPSSGNATNSSITIPSLDNITLTSDNITNGSITIKIGE